MKNKVDLHIHTTKSDGTKTPKEILIEAEQLGLNRISITDHESVQAYPEIAENRNLFSGVIVPGIELKTKCQGREIELLGYGFSLEEMEKNLPSIYKTKAEINKGYFTAIVQVLKSKGIVFPSQVEQLYGDNNITETQPSWFVWKIMEDDKENFERNLRILHSDKIRHTEEDGFYRNWLSNPESSFFVNYNAYPNYKQTIELIKRSGGKVFVPHIFQYKDVSISILEELLRTGNIDGIECYYSTFTPEQTNYLLSKCTSLNLFVSGGSDYHGTNKVNQLGIGINNSLYVPEEKVITWTNMLARNSKILGIQEEQQL